MSGDHNQYQKPASQCQRCGEKNPAEIHTCTPLDPLLEALRVPENKREWVGLPNDEVLERANKFRDPEMYLRGVLWAEAKLKEKNT